MTCSKNFHSSLTTSKELTQAVTKPSQSNITSAKRVSKSRNGKVLLLLIFLSLPPLLNTETVAPAKQKVGTHHSKKESAFPSSA